MAKKSQMVLDLEARIAELEAKLQSLESLNNSTDHQNTIRLLQEENNEYKGLLELALKKDIEQERTILAAKTVFTILRKIAKVRGTVDRASFNIKQKDGWSWLPTVLDANGALKLADELQGLTVEWRISKKGSEFYLGWKSANADEAVGE